MRKIGKFPDEGVSTGLLQCGAADEVEGGFGGCRGKDLMEPNGLYGLYGLKGPKGLKDLKDGRGKA